uniref:Uncharacterized protein n=1 Tax=Ditylenchus dipsaci TaxID=166011 RepID=A0A915E107_9BILA
MDANNFSRDGCDWTSDGNGPASSDGTRVNCAQSIASASCSGPAGHSSITSFGRNRGRERMFFFRSSTPLLFLKDNITFVKSEKGKDKAVHKGFPFKQQRKNKYGSAQDWQCVKIVLFGKERNIDWSADMKVTYWDGSFSMTPAPFYQVYAILAERSARNEEDG